MDWPYFDDMDAVLGTQHATEPPITIDTTVEHLHNAPAEPEDDGEETKDQLLESSSPTKKGAKGKSPLKQMAKLKKRARDEMFDAAIEKVTTTQLASDETFLAIEEKRLKMEEQVMQLQITLAFMSRFMLQYGQPLYPPMPPFQAVPPRSASPDEDDPSHPSKDNCIHYFCCYIIFILYSYINNSVLFTMILKIYASLYIS